MTMLYRVVDSLRQDDGSRELPPYQQDKGHVGLMLKKDPLFGSNDYAEAEYKLKELAQDKQDCWLLIYMPMVGHYKIKAYANQKGRFFRL